MSISEVRDEGRERLYVSQVAYEVGHGQRLACFLERFRNELSYVCRKSRLVENKRAIRRQNGDRI